MNRKKTRVILWLLLSLLALAFAGCMSIQPPAAEVPAEKASQEVPVIAEERDLVYATVDDTELRLDLVYQKNTKKLLPLIVFIHGSPHSFYMADKINFYYTALEAGKRGYVAATIAFRTTAQKVEGKSKYEFPAQVHDVKCAIRWLKANAARYGIDTSRVGAVGFSSGGYLALMLGLTDPSCGLEGECGDLGISSRVHAVVNLAGEIDAVLNYHISPTYYKLFLGGTPETLPDRYRIASPLTYVSADDPPVLTLIGGEDDRLPQAELLDAALKDVGVPHTLIVVPGALHYLDRIVDFAKDGPVWEFLDRQLRGGR